MFNVTSQNLRSISDAASDERHYINNTDAYTVGKPLDLSVADVLFMGEGNCSFTESWVENHMRAGESQVAKRVLCTELMSYEEMTIDQETARRIEDLSKLGTQFVYCLDATTSNRTFEGHTFRRIQFNCPHDRSNYYSVPPTLPPLVSGFFRAIESLQEPGDTVHMTLLQPPGKESLYQHFFQIVKGAEGTGVIFEDDLPFDNIRYRLYIHKMTFSNLRASNSKYCREFVFVRGANSNAITPLDRIDFEYPILEHGPKAGQNVLCDVYKHRSGRKTSYSALPPMRPELSSQGPSDWQKLNLENPDSLSDTEDALDVEPFG
ncbi:MAG: hypothetical protein S4CHLAM6_03940 [Chlamydiae bacterium]|nr:hypothetical protein [Chlamydiota bacterium]